MVYVRVQICHWHPLAIDVIPDCSPGSFNYPHLGGTTHFGNPCYRGSTYHWRLFYGQFFSFALVLKLKSLFWLNFWELNSLIRIFSINSLQLCQGVLCIFEMHIYITELQKPMMYFVFIQFFTNSKRLQGRHCG